MNDPRQRIYQRLIGKARRLGATDDELDELRFEFNADPPDPDPEPTHQPEPNQPTRRNRRP